MTLKKIEAVIVFSIPVFVVHGLEEYFTRFYETDTFFLFIFSPLKDVLGLHAIFLIFQFMYWTSLILFFIFLQNEKWRWRYMLIIGFIYIFELDHILKSVIQWDYYPGAITAIAFAVLGFIFWKEVFSSNKNTYINL